MYGVHMNAEKCLKHSSNSGLSPTECVVTNLSEYRVCGQNGLFSDFFFQ